MIKDFLALLAQAADAGDEDAALELNALAPVCSADVLQAASSIAARTPCPAYADETPMPEAPPPLVRLKQSLGDILSEALATAEPVADEWGTIGAAVDLIACHYRLPADAVWSVIFDLEMEAQDAEGVDAFGDLLTKPEGFGELGLRVAARLLGDCEAAALPMLRLNTH